MKTAKMMALAATALLLTTSAKAQTESTYTLTAGNMSMTIDADMGARILSLKWDDKEVISQLKWPESFGSTFWTSPQKDWNWPPVPEYDKQPYAVEKDGSRLVMRSGVSQRLGFRIEKAFAPIDSLSSVDITYSIINEGSEARSVAPWEITRVPNAGLIFFDAPTEAITPPALLNFFSAEGVAWYHADVTGENRKVNADGKGWLAYANNGLLLVKSFVDLSEAQPAPGEAEIQVYVNRGKTYIELESQGAYTTLQPGERLSWTVRWLLAPCAPDARPSARLIEQVKALIK